MRKSARGKDRGEWEKERKRRHRKKEIIWESRERERVREQGREKRDIVRASMRKRQTQRDHK